jgi:glutamyl-tRNA synthetase
MIELFDPKDINKSASSYNLDKLLWLNAHYIKNSSNEKLAELLKDFGVDLENSDKIDAILNATKQRAKTLKDLALEVNKILNAPSEYDEKSIKKAFKGEAIDILLSFLAKLKDTKELNSAQDYHKVMQDFVKEKEIGFGKIGQPLRVALLGSMSGPGLDEVMYIIGLDEVEKRVKNIEKFLKG